MHNYINNPVFIADTGFAIFFDDVRVDQFVKDYTVSMGVDSTIGTATINMVYVPDFDKIIHSDIKSDAPVEAAPAPAQEAKTSVVTKAKVVNCYHLAIRESPSMNNKEIAWVNAGDVLEYHGKGGNNDYWINVTSTNGKKGWAGGKYIELIDEVQGGATARSGNSIVVGSKVKINSSATNYATGQKIPSWVKAKEHTVQQLGSGKTLLKEIYSWVKSGDITLVSGGGASSGDSANKPSSDSTDNKYANGIEDGIENMTNVRIFVKNVFNGKYVQIFGGNITSKSITITGGEKSINFHAQDFMNWLSRTICPIAVPFDGTLAAGDRLKWKAQGIDLNKVQTVNSVKDITFKGKSLSETWDIISKQTIEANKIYSSDNTVSKFDDALSRVVIMGDIDKNLRDAEVVDFMINSSMTQVNSTYVLMNDILKTLMFEFYQDRDETIRIKPPFWNEHVLVDHVIDPSLILSYTESTNYSHMYTRVIATGGLDEWQKSNASSDTVTKMITPVVAVTSSGVTSNSGPVAVTSQVSSGSNYIPSETDGSIAASAVEIAKRYVGLPYVWGGDDPSEGGFDCSGLIYYAYKKAGYTGWTCRETTYTMIKKGWAVPSYNDLRVGDAIFPHSGHVYMYIGNDQIVEAQKTGTNIMIRKLPRGKNIGIRRFTNDSGSGLPPTQAETGVKPESVGSDSLLEPTNLEKKYGPLIYECSQPLIKFSTSASVGSDSAYDALTKYAKFMLNYLNSSVTMSSIQTISMPWVRPGFNVWVDPVRTDKIFYVNQINHYGNHAGNFSTFNLTLGRRRIDFTDNKTILGGLKPGKSDDIFVNQLLVTPENFGSVCNYKEVSEKVNSFYNSTKTERTSYAANSSHYSYFYGGSEASEFKVRTVEPKAKTVAEISVGSTVKIKSSAARYFTGEKIPGWVKEKTHTVQQVATNKILLKEIYSWVNRADVEGQGESAATNSGGSKTGTVYNVNSFLNVRNGPGTNYGTIGKLYQGNSVSIIKEQNGWYNIDFNGNTNAWCSKNYIKANESSTSATTENANSKYSSHSNSVFSNGELSLSDIQTKLSSKYSTANSVIKSRRERLKDVVNRSENMMKYIHASKKFD